MASKFSESSMPPVYMVRIGDRWGEGAAVDGMRYLCLEAMNKQEVRQYFRGYKNLSAVRVKVSEDFRLLIEMASQEVRKLAFDGATCEANLDRMAPGWRERDEADKLFR
jgi:hypothetical protein